NAIPSVYGACHGLLCLQEPSTDKAALWNPSTREFKILPPSSIQRPPYLSPMEGNLALYGVSFDHAALGFDSKTNDYKVIRFVSFIYYHSPFVTRTFVNIEEEQRYAYPHYEFQVELYSSRSDSWKEIPCPHYTPTDLILGNNYVDGICYWKTMTEAYLGLILLFDLANQKFSILPFPEITGSCLHYYDNLLMFNGSLSVIVCLLEGTGMSFDLWVASEGVWTKQFSIESISGVLHPLGFGKNEEQRSYPHYEFQVDLYSSRSDSWKEIPCPNHTPTDSNYLDGICYWKTNTEACLGLILPFDLTNEEFSILPFPEMGRSC
ncbi:hypothetical protein Goshw_026684, partial [Gossypium schwendimanii]|nr:hypothetical protein [Gossypium schwendimanii]